MAAVAKKFIPSLHPRGRDGRFTHSRSTSASLEEKKLAGQLATGLKPKRGITGARAPEYLSGIGAQQHADTVKAYTAGGYETTHKALRAGKTDEPSVAAMDAAMVGLPDDLVLSRRVPSVAFGPEGPESLVGFKVRDAAYTPTSVGTIRATKSDVRMRLAVPAGTGAAVSPETGEVILDRDLEMVVAKVEKNSLGGFDMYVTVLPKVGGKSDSKKGSPVAKAAEPKAAAEPKTDLKPAVPGDGPDQPKVSSSDAGGPESEAEFRSGLMKLKVVDLRAKMKERGLKPGKLLKSQLVDALVADETGGDGGGAPTLAAPKPEPPKTPAPAIVGKPKKPVKASPLDAAPISLVARKADSPLTQPQRDALNGYKKLSYLSINRDLRNGKTDNPQITAIDEVMAKSKLTDAVTVARGVKSARSMFGDRVEGDLTGLRWREDAFVSTTANEKTAFDFAAGPTHSDKGSIVLRINAPEGVGGITMSKAGYEAELLLDRGHDYEITKDHGVVDGVRVVDVEVLPKAGSSTAAKRSSAKAEPKRAAKPAPAPRPEPVPAKPKTPAEKIQAGDFGGLKRIGPQGGSNPGGIFEAEDGSRWYVKSQKSQKHANNEALAAALYRTAGVDAAEVVRGSGTPGLSGQHQTASRMIDGATADLRQRLDDPKYASAVRQGFAVDAWLANWDAAGLDFDNIVTGADGKPHRIDVGGSLLFRAQGGPKGSAFGEKVNEWTSLRDKKTAPTAAKTFSGTSRADLIAAIGRIEAVTPAQIRVLAAEYGLPKLADQLIARREDLVTRMSGMRSDAKRQAAWNAKLSNAAELQPGLDAASLHLAGTFGEKGLEPTPPGWDKSKTQAVGLSVRTYRGLAYESINRHMRGAPAKPGDEAHVANIKDALKAAPLARDVVVYRGVRTPAKTFGVAWNDVDVTGLEWDDKAFASTSVDRRVAEMFSGQEAGSVIMRIVQPKGVGAVRLSSLAPPDSLPAGVVQEAELLLGPQRRRVVADHGFDSKGVRILDVEVIADENIT